MGRISQLLFLLIFCLFQTTSWAFVQRWKRSLDYVGDYNVEEINYEGILPPAIIAKLNNGTDGDTSNEESSEGLQAVIKVASGNYANYGDFPHQVSLRSTARRNNHFCGASVIHPLLLLSAAHCFESHTLKPPYILAKVGEHSLMSADGIAEQTRQVTYLFVHEKYNSDTWDNDIAILVLNQSLVFSDHVSPIQLRDASWKLPDWANVSGWGEDQNRAKSDSLLYAELPVLTHENCTDRFKDSKYNESITRNMICAGGTKEDACEGDSGGPLTCLTNGTDGREERYLCGLVSWGFPCYRNKGHLPTMYTDVSKYVGWIRKFMRSWWRHYWITLLGQPRAGRSDCDEGTFRCPNNGLCLPEEFKCDGENDCYPLEDWDERNCTSVIVCPEGRFQCNSTQSCIPSIYVCDGANDCEDSSDELNCEQ